MSDSTFHCDPIPSGVKQCYSNISWVSLNLAILMPTPSLSRRDAKIPDKFLQGKRLVKKSPTRDVPTNDGDNDTSQSVTSQNIPIA